MLGYPVLHGSAPRYLGPLIRVADVPGRRTLRSAATNRLIVPSVKLPTVGSRAFPAAASSIWNSLPEYIVNAPSYSTVISTSSENFPVPTFIPSPIGQGSGRGSAPPQNFFFNFLPRHGAFFRAF